MPFDIINQFCQVREYLSEEKAREILELLTGDVWTCQCARCVHMHKCKYEETSSEHDDFIEMHSDYHYFIQVHQGNVEEGTIHQD